MGFYATNVVEQKTYPLSKNRVGGFRRLSPSRAWKIAMQPVEPHREKSPTPTKTASGMCYYGFRFYSPSLGRWVGRDPLFDLGFVLLHRQRMIAQRNGHTLYEFVGNNPVDGWDLLGLCAPQPRTLSRASCDASCDDIDNLISAIQGARDTMNSRLQSGGEFDGLDDLLEGLTRIGENNILTGGVTEEGAAHLTDGQQDIVKWFECSGFNSQPGVTDHPNPLLYHGVTDQYVRDWGAAEVRRLDAVLRELRNLASQRGCN